jgi:hypothetical protein
MNSMRWLVEIGLKAEPRQRAELKSIPKLEGTGLHTPEDCGTMRLGRLESRFGQKPMADSFIEATRE